MTKYIWEAIEELKQDLTEEKVIEACKDQQVYEYLKLTYDTHNFKFLPIDPWPPVEKDENRHPDLYDSSLRAEMKRIYRIFHYDTQVPYRKAITALQVMQDALNIQEEKLLKGMMIKRKIPFLTKKQDNIIKRALGISLK